MKTCTLAERGRNITKFSKITVISTSRTQMSAFSTNDKTH